MLSCLTHLSCIQMMDFVRSLDINEQNCCKPLQIVISYAGKEQTRLPYKRSETPYVEVMKRKCKYYTTRKTVSH